MADLKQAAFATLENALNGFLQRWAIRRRAAVEMHDNFARGIDDILVEVPTRRFSLNSKLAEHRISIIPAHMGRCEHRERNTVIDIADIRCLFLIVGFLTEIITGKANNSKALVTVLVIQFLQAFKLLCIAAVTCSVDNEQWLASDWSHRD